MGAIDNAKRERERKKERERERKAILAICRKKTLHMEGVQRETQRGLH